jgi:hypothetical protein
MASDYPSYLLQSPYAHLVNKKEKSLQDIWTSLLLLLSQNNKVRHRSREDRFIEIVILV